MKTQMSLSKIFGTIAIGGTLAATVLMTSAAHAGNCEPVDGKAIAGNYVPSSMLYDNVGRPAQSASVVVALKQNACELVVKTSVIETFLSYLGDGKVKPTVKKTSGGDWKFDLRGEKKAVIPKQYLLANSNDTAAAKMTKSLEIYTKQLPDGSIDFTALFDFEHAGAIVKMSAKANLKIAVQDMTVGQRQQKTTAMMYVGYPGVIFRIVPSTELAERTGARNLVITSGVNWLLEALDPQINNMLSASSISFFRQ